MNTKNYEIVSREVETTVAFCNEGNSKKSQGLENLFDKILSMVLEICDEDKYAHISFLAGKFL